jgi:carboxylesterase type B
MFLQPPEPADPWNGTLDATKFGKKCPALKRTDEEADFKKWTSLFSVEGTEDCLSLNVYTPQVNEVEPLFRAQYY